MAFSYITKTLILRPETDSRCGFQPLLGDAHVAACGSKIEGLRPFDASRRGNSTAASESKQGQAALAFDNIRFLYNFVLRPETDSRCAFQPLLGDAHVAACGS